MATVNEVLSLAQQVSNITAMFVFLTAAKSESQGVQVHLQIMDDRKLQLVAHSSILVDAIQQQFDKLCDQVKEQGVDLDSYFIQLLDRIANHPS